MFWRRGLLLFLGVVPLVAGSFAASPYKQPVMFTYTADVGFGNSVFVVGSHPDVGGWDVTKAVKLRYTSGEELQHLAQRDFPPRLTITAIDPLTQRTTFSYTSLFGFSHALQRSTDLSGWTTIASTPLEPIPWGKHDIEDEPTQADNSRVFWRLRYVTQP